MSETSESVLAHLAGTSPDERTEIAIRTRADSPVTFLSVRQQAWGNGIGWFTQATVDIPATSLSELKAALCLVPGALRRTSLLDLQSHVESESAPTVIPFPGLRVRNDHNQE